MAVTILVFGLPGSGKSTLANKLAKKLNADHFNADQVREMFNDWDFSEEGRKRQAERMKELGAQSKKQWAILDFVCPTEELRNVVEPYMTVFMDTIEKGRYEDTNSMFEYPNLDKVDYRFTEFESDTYAQEIATTLMTFDWKKPTTQMLGRWQPWHDGHTALFKKALAETGQVCIMIRDVGGIVGQDAGAGRTGDQTDNPFDLETVTENIIEGLGKEGFRYGREYIVQLVPNIVDISYGRGVGYTFTQHDLGAEIHDISATKIRAKMREEGKL